ncbi:MAG: winged helix-turn-helix transcriptional regulator [Planctomycetes bacterium]|nr:winged helix-turn-helix transcriptional regulator [Planctomycetota bacterium]
MDEPADQHEPPPPTVESIAGAMRDLGRDIHLEILSSLARSRKSVRDLSEEVELALSDVSKSLRQLQQYGLVEYRRDKNRHIYRLTDRVTVRNDETQYVELTVSALDGSTLTIRQGIEPGA